MSLSPRTIHPVGDHGLLVDLPDLAEVMAWHAELNAHPLPGQREAIAAASTLLVILDSPAAVAAAARTLADFQPATHAADHAEPVTIEVVYDGADLSALAAAQETSEEALIAWHTSTEWVGAFGGFAPGFTYCVPADPADARSVKRLDSPRTAVPAGAVGLADSFSAVYPRTSPGGWQLIGHSPTPLWDATATPPALVGPNTPVRYRAVREAIELAPPPPAQPPASPSRALLTVESVGMQTLYQDAGRGGQASLGVTGSGAADGASARAANAAVGNAPGAVVLENIGGMTLRALVDAVVAVAGADAPITRDRLPVPPATPILVPAGSELTVGPARRGLRSYLAVRGGLSAPTELGSAATDVLSGLGPDPLEAGAVLRGAAQVRGSVGLPGVNPLRKADPDGAVSLRVIPGPRAQWFQEAANALSEQEWTVTPTSNRVGLRLSGCALAREDAYATAELPSEGMVAGSIQVPPNGQPVVFLRDHPVPGGYPVIATVVAADVDAAGQLAPGDTVRFVPLPAPIEE